MKCMNLTKAIYRIKKPRKWLYTCYVKSQKQNHLSQKYRMRLAVLTFNLSPPYACLSTIESREFYSARLRLDYSTCTISRRRTAPRSCSSLIFFLIVVLHALSRFTSHIRCSLRCHMTHALASSGRLAASLCSIRFHR